MHFFYKQVKKKMKIETTMTDAVSPVNHVVQHDIDYHLQVSPLPRTCQKKHIHLDSLLHQAEDLFSHRQISKNNQMTSNGLCKNIFMWRTICTLISTYIRLNGVYISFLIKDSTCFQRLQVRIHTIKRLLPRWLVVHINAFNIVHMVTFKQLLNCTLHNSSLRRWKDRSAYLKLGTNIGWFILMKWKKKGKNIPKKKKNPKLKKVPLFVLPTISRKEGRDLDFFRLLWG